MELVFWESGPAVSVFSSEHDLYQVPNNTFLFFFTLFKLRLVVINTGGADSEVVSN